MTASLRLAMGAALLAAAPAHALESDQFTLPHAPLGDTGVEVAALVWGHVEDVVAGINAAIADNRHKASISTTRPGRAWRERKVEELQAPDHLAREVYRRLGRGGPETRIEVLVREHGDAFEAQPAFHHPAFGETIYRKTGFVRPLNVFGIVPTMQLHGVYLGTDKIGHLFQQGHEYYTIFRQTEADVGSRAAAFNRAVEAGVGQESGIYGQFPSGTFSNADLAANYAGLKFYLNLTEPVLCGPVTLPALFVRDGGLWRANSAASERHGHGLLEPLITNHLSEAMNPPLFDWTMRKSIRSEIRRRALRWIEFHSTNRDGEIRRLRRMKTWFEEDYGHSGFEDVLTVVNVFFESQELTARLGD